MTPSEQNFARERLSGESAQPFELTVAPDVADLIRWTLANADGIIAEEERATAPPPDS